MRSMQLTQVVYKGRSLLSQQYKVSSLKNSSHDGLFCPRASKISNRDFLDKMPPFLF